jgi:hypothetical protein
VLSNNILRSFIGICGTSSGGSKYMYFKGGGRSKKFTCFGSQILSFTNI